MRTLGLSCIVVLMAAAPALAQQTPASTGAAAKEWPASPALATRPEAQHPMPSPDRMGGGAIPALPLEIMTSGDITYITGGIGDEEEAELKSRENDFNLHLMLTAGQGEYISDVALHVADAQGKEVLVVNDAGPYFYAHLKSGTYTLTATNKGGQSKTAKVKVPETGAARQHLAFQEEGGITTVHEPKAKID